MLIQRQELHITEPGSCIPIGQNHGNVLRHPGKNLSCGLEDFVQTSASFVKPAINQCSFVIRKGARFNQRIHIQPISLSRGYTSCRGVGLLQISQKLQITHLITDGGRAKTQIIFASNGAGANRLSSRNIILNYELENFFLSIV